MKNSPHNVRTIKNDNRALILNYIRRRPTSRADISKKSNMSKSAVTMITNDLIKEGQIIEVGATSSTRGRKQILLDIIPNHRVAAGIALHRKYIYICITDLKSNILAYSNHKISQWGNPYEALDFAYEEILRFLDQLKIPVEKCIGIGVSAPGPLDYVTGKILNPPDFEFFHHVTVGDYLRQRSGLPVTVDNNSVLLTMQQYMIDDSHNFKNYMFVVVSDGIGSAIMTNGNIYRGFGGFAGELGHTSVHADGIPCSCGNKGCLEKYINIKTLQEKFGFSSYEKLVDDAYMGDSESNQILEYVADEFSCAIANTINMFDLDGVIIHGQISYRSDKLAQMLQERINQRSVITRTHEVCVYFSKMRPDEASSSVCSAIINRYFEQKL
jgi:predicted NBD/HSP70 family sugar kinase